MLKEYIKKGYYRIKYHRKHIKLGRGTYICGFNTKFEGNNVIGDHTLFSGCIGYGSYIGKKCWLVGSIGRFCSIASDVEVIIGNHPSREFVSTHPAFFSVEQQAGFTYVDETIFKEHAYAKENYYVSIGNDVWIGQGVKILNGISIGDGAIVAMGAVVVEDVAPYSVVGGVPAKHIRYRFSEKERDFLINFKWWDMSPEWISENAKYFVDIKKFMQLAEKCE